MKTLSSLDFRQPRRVRFWGARSSDTHRLAAALTLAFGVVGVITGIAAVRESLAQERALRQHIEQLRGELETLSPSRTNRSIPLPQQDVERQARIVHQLNLPWAEVLSTLEQLRPDGVAMVSMEPAGTGSLRLQTESLSLDRLLAYAAALQSTGPFGSLVYTRHETNERDPNQPVRLSFEIALKGRAAP